MKWRLSTGCFFFYYKEPPFICQTGSQWGRLVGWAIAEREGGGQGGGWGGGGGEGFAVD